VPSRKVYPTDVTDEEWEFVAPYLTLMKEDAAQRVYALRDVFDAVRWMAKAACPWRLLPGDFPPWQVVEQQSKRWIKAGCFEAMVHDLRAIVRRLHERAQNPSAVVFDGRTLQSSPESGGRAGYDGYKRKKGRARCMSPWTRWAICSRWWSPQPMSRNVLRSANWPETSSRGHRAKRGTRAYVDQGYTGKKPAAEATAHGIQLEEVVKLTEAKRGFVLLPRRPRGGAILRLAGALSTLVPRLRTAAHHARRSALAGLCLPFAEQLVQDQYPKLMTDSKQFTVCSARHRPRSVTPADRAEIL
jgi:transposase